MKTKDLIKKLQAIVDLDPESNTVISAYDDEKKTFLYN